MTGEANAIIGYLFDIHKNRQTEVIDGDLLAAFISQTSKRQITKTDPYVQDIFNNYDIGRVGGIDKVNFIRFFNDKVRV